MSSSSDSRSFYFSSQNFIPFIAGDRGSIPPEQTFEMYAQAEVKRYDRERGPPYESK